jgi:chromosome segregation ATPase
MLNSILQSVDTEIVQAERDEMSYIALCSALEEEERNDKGQAEKFEREISLYNKEIGALSDNLHSIEAERSNLRAEAQTLEKEAAQLDEQEAVYWAEVATYRQRQNTFEQERDELLAKVAAKEQMIEQLSQSVLEHEVSSAHPRSHHPPLIPLVPLCSLILTHLHSLTPTDTH